MDKLLIAAAQMPGIIRELAGKISAAHSGDNYALVGIHQQGVPLAALLQAEIAKSTGFCPELAKLDISMYRDDIGSHLPRIRETEVPFDVNDRVLILVDDVLSSGRTIRAALDALTDYGRPGIIRLAVLIDRGGAEFPIRADFVGRQLELPPDHRVTVRFESDGDPGVYDTVWDKKKNTETKE